MKSSIRSSEYVFGILAVLRHRKMTQKRSVSSFLGTRKNVLAHPDFTGSITTEMGLEVAVDDGLHLRTGAVREFVIRILTRK